MFFAISAFAQDIEDRDDSFILQNNKNLLKINIKDPFYQIVLKNCKNNFTAASFEGGISAYKALLQNYMFQFLNSEYYTLNGDFTFKLIIDENGRVKDVEGSPKVLNSEVFFEDMKYVVRRIKKNWIPAKCNNTPVTSEIEIKMNFSSITTDV